MSAALARVGRVRARGWQRVTRGAYVAGRDRRDPIADLAAWQLAIPATAAFTGLTSALVRGWWLPPIPVPTPVFVALRHADPRPRRPGLVVQRRTEGARHQLVRGLRVTTTPETLLAAARDLALLDLVVLIDAALSAGDCELRELTHLAGGRQHGVPRFRRALRYADGRSESPWETMLRVLLVVCGVPVEPQYVVRDSGRFVARGDLWIRGSRRLFEYDGGVHRQAQQHVADLARDRRLLRLGWQRFGYTAGVVLHDSVSILRDADEACGRAHQPQRIQAWQRLLAESSYTAAGRSRLRASWAGPMGFGSLTTDHSDSIRPN